MPADYLDDDYDPLAPPVGYGDDGDEADPLAASVPQRAAVAVEEADEEPAPVDDPEDIPAADIDVTVRTEGPTEPGVDDGDEALQDAAGEGDGGVGDGRGVVRVWVEDGRLARVRLSPVWHAKIPAERLGDAFASALAKAVQVAEVGIWDPAADDEDVDFDRLPALTPSIQAAFEARLTRIENRWRKVLADQIARGEDTEPEPVWGRSEGAGVTVDSMGRPVAVDFDPHWVRATHAGQVARHVVTASDRARARAREHRVDTGELDRLAIEFRVMRLSYEAMARKAADDVR